MLMFMSSALTSQLIYELFLCKEKNLLIQMITCFYTNTHACGVFIFWDLLSIKMAMHDEISICLTLRRIQEPIGRVSENRFLPVYMCLFANRQHHVIARVTITIRFEINQLHCVHSLKLVMVANICPTHWWENSNPPEHQPCGGCVMFTE